MTSSPDNDPLQSPHPKGSESSLVLPKLRGGDRKSAFPSLGNLPYGRPNASLSKLFSSTTSLSSASPHESSQSSPSATPIDGSVFSPDGAKSSARSSSPASAPPASEVTSLILQAFVPHVSVLSSPDCEELVRHKGIHGGLLQLLRPFGEKLPGRVVIRDHTGASKPWDDFGIRFTGVKDGLEPPRQGQRTSTGEGGAAPHLSTEYRPARLRSGGDAVQIDDVVERHLDYAESLARSYQEDYLNHKETQTNSKDASSPFYSLYLRRLLSGLVLSPHETFAHPAALVIAISSRNPSPIEELRTLYTSSNTGEHRLPPWVNNEYLRYYVLIHDEDYDDIKKSTTLYEQMKRHFGLHCHLLRLRSSLCVASDDDSYRLPDCEWMSAGEELAEIVERENMEGDEDPSSYIFESDAGAIRSFVREMVTQSIIPSMERMTATWNDQVASRRRGISGRFMSLSKRFTPFSGRSATGPASMGSGSNYDSVLGSYRPDAAEAILRKLADYALMLRDFKLAQSTYDILCTDFKNDKAWKYYAGANEMAAITTLLTATTMTAKVRVDTVDQMLENAYYSYATRCSTPFYALRTLALGAELLKIRGGSSLDDAARWLSRLAEDRMVGPAGHALLLERIATCFASRNGIGSLHSGSRKRKAAFCNVLSASAWLDLDKPAQAEARLLVALDLYGLSGPDADGPAFAGINQSLQSLRLSVDDRKPSVKGRQQDVTAFDERDFSASGEPIQQETEKIDQRSHRRGASTASAVLSFDPPKGAQTATPLSTTVERPAIDSDGFE